MKRSIVIALCLVGLGFAAGCVHQPDLDLIAPQPAAQPHA